MKKRVINAGELWDVKVRGCGSGRAKLILDTEKHKIRFEINWWDIQYIASELWRQVKSEQAALDHVKSRLRGEG